MKARTLASLSPRIGALACDVLERHQARFDRKAAGAPRALRALLKRHGYPVHDAVLAFDSTFGGLEIPESVAATPDWEMSFLVGAHACLASGGHSTPRGGAEDLVPVAYGPNDIIWFLDGEGRAWACDTIGGSGCEPYAADGACMIARVVLGLDVHERRFKSLVGQVAGHRGREIAEVLALAPITEATDGLSRWWGDAITLFFEPPSPAQEVTVIASADRARVAAWIGDRST